MSSYVASQFVGTIIPHPATLVFIGAMSSAVLATARVYYQRRIGNGGPIPAVVHGPSKRGLEYSHHPTT